MPAIFSIYSDVSLICSYDIACQFRNNVQRRPGGSTSQRRRSPSPSTLRRTRDVTYTRLTTCDDDDDEIPELVAVENSDCK
jgi:hypothetical protein